MHRTALCVLPILTAFALTGVAPSEASANSIRAGGMCKGKVKLTGSGGAKNNDKKDRITVTCLLTRTEDTDTNGAEIIYSLRRSTKTGKKGKCTVTSYDNLGASLASNSVNLQPSNDVALGSISVFTSDGDSAGGYYIFQCLLPAKWTIQTLEVEE